MRCNPSYWLLGLIPIALLSWLAVQLEHEGIEADLGRRTQDALARKGLTWSVPMFAGRDGVLTGRSADDNEPARAIAAMRETWGVRVVDNRAELLEQIDRYLWSAISRDGRLVLTGYVPSEDARREIAEMAREAFPRADIKDELKPARGVPDRAPWMRGIGFGLKQLAQLKRGSVDMEGLDFSIAGEAPTAPVYKTVKTALQKMPGGVKLVSDKITPPVVNPFVWSAKSTSAQVQISGYVPSDKLREQLTALAKASFPRAALSDKSEVADGAPDGWAAAAQAAVKQLAALKSGNADIKGREMVFTGEAANEAAAQAVTKALRLEVPRTFKLTDNIRYPKGGPEAASGYTMAIAAEPSAVEVTGFVPTQEARAALIELVKVRFPGRQVTDKLQLQPGAPEGWQECIVSGLNALPRLQTGKAVLTDRKLLVTGSTADYGVSKAVPADVKAAAGGSCETSAQISYTGAPVSDLRWLAEHGEDGSVVLSGEIPGEDVRPVIVSAAKRLFPQSRVTDRMKVSQGPAQPWTALATRGLEQLARLRHGTAQLEQQTLSLSGVADSEDMANAIRTALARDVPEGYGVDDNINVARKIEIIEEADRCQDLLRETAAVGIITFDRAKADLTQDSTDTLEALAEIANACPAFRIVIEGHTDAEGTDERNQRLSDRRARAVQSFLVRAGVSASRLTAVGYGATRPIADNDTAEGRAKNRRIEFTVKGN